MFLRNALAAALLWALPAAADNSGLVGLTRIEQASPWKAVGRLDNGGGFCTATLIAPDLVLTAAHCTYREDGTAVAAKELTFRAGFREGRAEAERNVIQIARPEAYQYDGGEAITRIANDVALLRLSIPIATHVISPFVVEPRLLREGEVSVVSYGRGREDLPSFQDTCSVLRSFQGVMAMDCNVTFGSSGAPVFRRDGERIRIASIISGTASFNGVQYTTGMELPTLVTALKRKMVAEGAPPPARIKRIGVGTRTTAGGAKFVRPGGS
ncbi:trypsin-like serine protease [Sulfitobacter sp.]|uniref:trypsin-like serine peptidase n=1 Tax=Sulfitobacter sp. TaxID=1903071 RepID=UPI00329A48FF